MRDRNEQVRKQTEKQQVSKSPLYGYRKPINDGFNSWCNCSIPNLISAINKGQAYCIRCGCDWYV